MSCLTAIKLYKTIVPPRSLYGAELWFKITNDQLKKLERAHRFCLKIIQAMPKRTKTCIVQCMVNVFSLEAYIDLKKLLFFGRLCRLDCSKLAKQLFLERLYQYVCNSNSCTGFVSDLFRILEKYGLEQYIEEYITTCSFPDKSQWKFITQSHVRSFEENKLQVEFRDHKLKRFSQVYGSSLIVHPIWSLEHKAKGHRWHVKDFAKLNGVLCDANQDKECVYCNRPFSDHLDHYFHSCEKYQGTREYFWSLIINTCTVQFSAYAYNLSDDDLTCIMLGQKPSLDITESEAIHWLTICAKVWQILTYERDLPYYCSDQ